MFTLTSGKLYRAAALILASASAFLIASAGPAMALCRYGSPHCVNPHWNPAVLEERKSPSIDDAGGNGQDPDCAYYGNCLPDNVDDGCWYVDGACRPNAQAPSVRLQPSPRLQPRTTSALQTRSLD